MPHGDLNDEPVRTGTMGVDGGGCDQHAARTVQRARYHAGQLRGVSRLGAPEWLMGSLDVDRDSSFGCEGLRALRSTGRESLADAVLRAAASSVDVYCAVLRNLDDVLTCENK